MKVLVIIATIGRDGSNVKYQPKGPYFISNFCLSTALSQDDAGNIANSPTFAGEASIKTASYAFTHHPDRSHVA